MLETREDLVQRATAEVPQGPETCTESQPPTWLPGQEVPGSGIQSSSSIQNKYPETSCILYINNELAEGKQRGQCHSPLPQ